MPGSRATTGWWLAPSASCLRLNRSRRAGARRAAGAPSGRRSRTPCAGWRASDAEALLVRPDADAAPYPGHVVDRVLPLPQLRPALPAALRRAAADLAAGGDAMTARLSYEEQLVLEEAANIVLALRRAEPRILPDEEDATLLRQATDKLRLFITTPWPRTGHRCQALTVSQNL